MKVVIHVGRPEQWSVAVGNSKNLRVANPRATIEIVVNSSGITLFKNLSEDIAEDLINLVEIGTEVKLCRNALRKNSIDESTLPSEVEVVPAGIVELIEKQNEGYAYVSP